MQKRKTKTIADNIDVRLGARLKAARVLRGLTQTELGAVVGVSFQQIQKYEMGKNRMSVMILWRFCDHLNMPISQILNDIGLTSEDDANISMEALKVSKNYLKIKEPTVRNAIKKLIKSLADL